VDSQQRGSPAWGLGVGEATHHNNLYDIKCLTKPWTWTEYLEWHADTGLVWLRTGFL
jgi:hypothetical protein